MTLSELGWNPSFAERLPPKLEGLEPARVIVQLRGKLVVADESGERLAEVSGRFRHLTRNPADYPVVGDWVLVQTAGDLSLIHAVLPRRTKFSRNSPGRAVEEQVIAANMDTVFVVASLSGELKLRRIERYLALAVESGAAPVLVLTKSDLCPDPCTVAEQARQAAPDFPVITVSGVTHDGFDALDSFLNAGQTIALLGPSGVGKSTLINSLCGDDLQLVQEVREKDEKGRHTTTRRELFQLPSGALVIDTPGMRELQLWETEEGIEQAFGDLLEIATRCRFTNCQHQTEPGCAVREAIQSGVFSAERLASFHKLQREREHFETRHDARAESRKKGNAKAIEKQLRSHYKLRGKRESG